tara:strand:- start:1555 stop:2133 length:579 start_codon:yes stop_codon:yes gene_type:complete
MGTMLILPKVRTIHVDALFTPKHYLNNPANAARYTGTFLIPKGSDLDAKIWAMIDEVGKETFGKTWAAKFPGFKASKDQLFYRDGDLKEQDYYHGHMFIAANRNADGNQPPAIVNKDVKDVLTLARGVIYGGCFVNGKVDVWGQEGKTPGIRASLEAVQFYADGDAIAGAGSAPTTEGFDSLDVDEDMMAGL